MYMLKSVVSVALFAAYAIAQSTLQFTSTPPSVQAGSTYVLTWTGGDSTQPVTILLRQGNPGDLKTVGTLTTNGVGGSYSWTVDPTIVDASDYAFEVVQGTQNNYSGLFAVSGGSGTSSAAASSTSAAASSASSSASASAASASASASSASASASSSSASASASASKSSSASASKTSATTASTSAPSNSGANGLQSPFALLCGVVAAMMYFN